MADMKISVSAKSENQTRTVVDTGNFRITVDEPEKFGGTDKGANPIEFQLAALAGCLNVVGHLVAREMGIRMEGLGIKLEGDFNPAKFMGKPTPDRTGYKEIRVSMSPDTDASLELLEEWAEKVEERCPVSDNLKNPTSLKITVSKN